MKSVAQNYVLLISPSSSITLPSAFGSQTGWWDASAYATTFYTDAGTTLATSDGQTIYRLGDKSGNNRNLDQSSGVAQGVIRLNIQNGLAALQNQTSVDMYYTGAAMSNFFTASTKCAFIAVKNVVSGTDSATVYQNDALLVAVNGFWGVTVRSSGPVYQYNYGGGETATGITLSNSETAVITAWHTGGNLYLQKNLGTPVSIAATNTTNLTGALGLFGGYGSFHARGYFLEASVHNAYSSDDLRTAVIASLMSKWSIT